MTFLHAFLWTFVMTFLVLDTQHNAVRGEEHSGASSDRHGGVPMGKSNPICDDAKENIEIDWDPKSKDEYTCTEERQERARVGLHYSHCDQIEQKPLHICYPKAIHYDEDLPTSGSHRPLWPVYGEYMYAPPQRWLHSLEHGAVVFLYHPCADPDQIEEFKAVARGCLRRHIISPYKKMPPEMNFALLTWKCKLTMSSVDVSLMVDFVKTHALKGPEAVSSNGQYNVGLIQPASVVSNSMDSKLCPSMSLMSSTARAFKDMSLARRQKSRQSQENLEQVLAAFMEDFADYRK